MSRLISCAICGTRTSGEDNERFFDYQERLIEAARIARDETSLLFIAKDMLKDISTGVTSSDRELEHEKSDESSFNSGSHLRLADPERALKNIQIAIRALSLAEDSLNKHIETK